MVEGEVSFHLKFAFKVTHTLWKVPTSTAYNVSIVRAIKKFNYREYEVNYMLSDEL